MVGFVLVWCCCMHKFGLRSGGIISVLPRTGDKAYGGLVSRDAGAVLFTIGGEGGVFKGLQ